jgi:hypothetical protein
VDNTGDHHALFNARASDQTWLVHPELRSDGGFRWLLRAAGGDTIFDIRAGQWTAGEWIHFGESTARRIVEPYYISMAKRRELRTHGSPTRRSPATGAWALAWDTTSTTRDRSQALWMISVCINAL